MTVSNDQIIKAKNYGIQNIDTAAQVCDETGTKFYHLCALLEKESGGRNVFGNDVGGTLRGFKEPITECNWRAFRHEVLINGQRSNGVGPMQITFKGFFTDMEAKGLHPWIVHDNMLYGAGLWNGYYRAQRNVGYSVEDAIMRSGTKYNTGSYGTSAYGEALLNLMRKWRSIVGSSDYS